MSVDGTGRSEFDTIRPVSAIGVPPSTTSPQVQKGLRGPSYELEPGFVVGSA